MIRFLTVLAVAFAAVLPAHAAVDIEEVTSEGGITAWLVEDHQIPFVALEIRFQGGASLDLPEKRGAANLMTGLLEEGAGQMDSRAFAEAREEIAAGISFDVNNDELSVSARFLTETRDEAVALIRAALTEPRFDADAIERVREQVLSGIRSDATDPDRIASATFRQLAYAGHPYATDVSGTIESVGTLTREDLVEVKDRIIARDRIFVAAAGDITPEELGTLLDNIFADLPETGAPMPERAEVDLEAGVTLVPFETPQSVAFFGQPGIPRDDPDFFAAFVANSILGGSGRQSRLTDEVREARGLTYGIGAYLVNFDHADMLLGQFASANARVAEAIDVVREEWAKIVESGVTETELEEAKTYLTGAYPLRFDSNAAIARILVGMQLGDLPIDYVNTRNDKVNAVTLDDVAAVARRLYDPEALRFVVVGQPEGLEGAEAPPSN